MVTKRGFDKIIKKASEPISPPTSHWTYRVVKSKIKLLASGAWETEYAIHEAYYKKGKLVGFTKEPINVAAGSLTGLKWVLKGMLQALDHHTIPYTTFHDGRRKNIIRS